MSNEATHLDTVAIVRICIKCADALSDYDISCDLLADKKSKYVKHAFKDTFLQYGKHIENFSSRFLVPFVEADADIEKNLQQMFNDFSSKINVGTEEQTAFILFYSKAKSIHADLLGMDYKDSDLTILRIMTKEFTDAVEQKYASLLKITDSQGYGVPDIINGLDRLGKKIMFI